MVINAKKGQPASHLSHPGRLQKRRMQLWIELRQMPAIVAEMAIQAWLISSSTYSFLSEES